MHAPRRQTSGISHDTRGFVHRHAVIGLFLIALFSNAAASVFNILYNDLLIARYYLDAPQHAAFWKMVSFYNFVAYPICLGIVIALLRPLATARRLMAVGAPLTPSLLHRCQRLLINLPFYQVCLNFAGWMVGIVAFPLGIGLLGGWNGIGGIAGQFAISFVVSAFIATVQTYFILEAFLFTYLYPDFFREDRPADMMGPGLFQIRFAQRLTLYWTSVALMPLVAVLAVVLNIPTGPDLEGRMESLRPLALGVGIVGVLSSAVIGMVVSRTLMSWVRSHTEATEQIALGNFDYRISEKRPGEFGRLTDRVNDMAAALARARQVRETFGQMVGPEVRDSVLDRYADGLGGEVEDITVVFVDLRGFTQRSASETPERVFELLNHFFTLSFTAMHQQCGHVNKFLGDGMMVLFGVPHTLDDHADRAVMAALDLVRRLNGFNDQLILMKQQPLAVGIGIHSGPALVGCSGAAMPGTNGRRVRKEFTALGATVNLAQRLEQLTKVCGGPILMSEATRRRLVRELPLTELGRQQVSGCEGGVVVFRVEAGSS